MSTSSIIMDYLWLWLMMYLFFSRTTPCLLYLTSPETLQLWQPSWCVYLGHYGSQIAASTTLLAICFANQLQEKHRHNPLTPDNLRTLLGNSMLAIYVRFILYFQWEESWTSTFQKTCWMYLAGSTMTLKPSMLHHTKTIDASKSEEE